MDDLFEATKTDKNDRRRLLPMCFGDDVKKWYRNENRASDYDEFKQQFISTFTSSTYKLKIISRMINRRQGNGESVQTYFYDMISLCTRFNQSMGEDEKVVHILRGLKPSIQERIIINNPKSCEELLDQAKRIETAAIITQQRESTTTATNELVEETTAALSRSAINLNGRYANYTNETINNKYMMFVRDHEIRATPTIATPTIHGIIKHESLHNLFAILATGSGIMPINAQVI